MLTLYHLAISHFSEKVRWALDLKGLDYRSRLLTPAYHILTVKRVAGTRTVPVLVDTESGAVVADSTDALHFLDHRQPEPALFPDEPELAARVATIEDFCDEEIGPRVAGYLYTFAVDRPDVLLAAWSHRRPASRRLLLRVTMPLLRAGLRRTRGLDAASRARHRQAVFAGLDRLAGWLREGSGDYLAGGGFTAADLTAAVLLGPAVRPGGSPWHIDELPPPPRDYPPPPVRAFFEEVSRHPIADWVRAVWARHRGLRRPY